MVDAAVRVSDEGAVRRLTLCRPESYNTITPQLRDELGAAVDAAQHDRSVRVILLDAEGPAFCAGYDLGWSTGAQAGEDERSGRRWDTAADLHLIGPYAATWAKLHESTKPTVAAVQGLVHRGRHEHRVQRPPHRGGAVCAVRLPAVARVGRAGGPVELGRTDGHAERPSLHAHG